jgi:GT2 family glycosyltransferase
MNVSDPLVCIVVLNWNGLRDTIECLESLQKIAYPNHKVVVVDNASASDDAGALRQKFGDYAHIIQNDKNYGYTGGNNIGIRYGLQVVKADYLLILNNDTTVAPDFLGHLVGTAETDSATGVAGPKVYYYDFPDRIQSAGMRVNMWTGQATLIGSRRLDTGQHRKPQEVDAVSGCCLLIKREAIRTVGEFDESYFCYWDETDYCARIRKAGLKVLCVPEAWIWHKMPMKQRLSDMTPTAGKSRGLAQYCAARNQFRFMRRHATRWQYASFLAYFFAYRLWFMAALNLLYHRDIRAFKGFSRGTLDGLLKPDAEPTFKPEG